MDRLTELDIFGKKEPLYQMSHGCLNPGGFWLRYTLCILVFPPLWSTARQCRWIFHFHTRWFQNALLLSAYQQFWCISFWLYCIRAFNSSLHAHLFRFRLVYHNVGHCGPPPAFERHVWGRAEFASLIHISYRFTSLNKNGIFQAKTRATLNWAEVNAS